MTRHDAHPHCEIRGHNDYRPGGRVHAYYSVDSVDLEITDNARTRVAIRLSLEAARELAGVLEGGSGHEVVLHEAAAQLIDATPGAENLADVGRIRERDWGDLLAEETGLSRPLVRAVTGH
jgi:hypothetical protein